jgi:hypothetical protein
MHPANDELQLRFNDVIVVRTKLTKLRTSDTLLYLKITGLFFGHA